MQLDEKWAFVAKKEAHCDPDDPADARRGDHWDHVAFDPEHKLVVSLVPGKRTREHVRALLRDFHRRTKGRAMRLITSDEYRPYRDAILRTYGERHARPRRGRRGRPPKPELRAPQDLLYAVVHKQRRQGRVVKVEARVVFGTPRQLDVALARSSCSRAVNVAFVERYNGTDRHQNARKVRKSYRFSKDWSVHKAATYFSAFSYNFCWPVRTLRHRREDGSWGPPRSPAMAAGLTDHVWALEEWLTHPAVSHSRQA